MTVPAHVRGMVRNGNIYQDGASVTALVKQGMTSFRENKRDGRIWASQAAVCTRQAVLSSTRDDTEITEPAGAGYYALGSAIEDIVLKALQAKDALLFAQFKLPDIGLNMGGYIDGIVRVGGRVRVLEVKSCGDLPKQPKLEHRAQAMIYAAVTGLQPTLFYFSRGVADFAGNLRVREFAMTPTRDELQDALFKVAFARECMELGLIPERPISFTSQADCGFCPWKDICWNGAELPRPEIDPEQSLEVTRKAIATVERLLAPERVAQRRNGVLRHIQHHGSQVAKDILAGDWSELVRPD
jgi:CRISPR/Cas system-associated exonuclease Cas4 (RecB family)